MSEKVVRYDTQSLLVSSEMKQSEDGEYVRYYDYKNLADEHNRLHGKYGEALAEKSQLAARLEELEGDVEEVLHWNHSVAVCPNHTADILGEADDCVICENNRLREALEWALKYGEFAVAVDNPLHARALDGARAALKETEDE